MMRVTLGSLIVASIIGCGTKPGPPAKTPAGGTGPVATDTATGYVAPEPVPFHTIALASDSSYTSQTAAEGALPGEVREFTKLEIKFCWCPPGHFRMGTSEDAPQHLLNERPVEVTLSRGFWMQQTELTQNQYQQLMGCNPSFFRGEHNPVDSVTWDEATEFCRRLSELPPEKEAGNLFRLPTEAEWEYACRAGITTEWCYGDNEEGMEEYGWYHKNSGRTTHPVGEKRANAWGLFDMHGNVSEWCQDFYGEYPSEPATDPRGPETGDTRRTFRGGGWFFVAEYARSAYRDAHEPADRYVGRGFRLVATTSPGASRGDNRQSETR